MSDPIDTDDIETDRVSVIVPSKTKERAMNKTEHGDLSKALRKTVELLAEGVDPDKASSISMMDIDVSLDVDDNDKPTDWIDRRNEAINRENYTCQNCGLRRETNPGELEVHHIVPKRYGGSHHDSNLAVLCNRCHRLADR